MDNGRREIESIFQQIMVGLKDIFPKSTKINELIKNLEIWLKTIKGNPSLLNDFIEPIWDDPKKIEISNVDKISFEKLLNQLEEVQQFLIDSNQNKFLNNWKKKE